MPKKKRHNPWVWIPWLFATEGVVSATVTYVALLMFFQLGASYSMATLLSASLLIPSIIKQKVIFTPKTNRLLKFFILLLQVLLFAAFVLIAFVIKAHKYSLTPVFLSLLLVSFLNALNEKCVAKYYSNQLDRKKQNLFGNYKYVASQLSFVVTYGILIIFVGLHEIFFRNVSLAWAMENYLIAGVLLILLIVNATMLKRPNYESAVNYRYAKSVYKNWKLKARNARFLLIIALLLLPQALLFATRVFFLMAPSTSGGLGCTLQDVGFAQGTIGVIAFSIGTFVGQHLIRRFGNKSMFWVMILPLIASPVFYMIMNFLMLTDLIYICIMTFLSQLCFGFGLNICVIFVKRTTGIFEDNIINLVHNPLVVAAMFIPIAVSGWLVELMGFKIFFIVNAASAILSILTILLNYKFIVRHILNYRKIIL